MEKIIVYDYIGNGTIRVVQYRQVDTPSRDHDGFPSFNREIKEFTKPNYNCKIANLSIRNQYKISLSQRKDEDRNKILEYCKPEVKLMLT